MAKRKPKQAGRPRLHKECGLWYCHNHHYARGYCHKHYMSAKVYGSHLSPKKPHLIILETAVEEMRQVLHGLRPFAPAELQAKIDDMLSRTEHEFQDQAARRSALGTCPTCKLYYSVIQSDIYLIVRCGCPEDDVYDLRQFLPGRDQ